MLTWLNYLNAVQCVKSVHPNFKVHQNLDIFLRDFFEKIKEKKYIIKNCRGQNLLG